AECQQSRFLEGRAGVRQLVSWRPLSKAAGDGPPPRSSNNKRGRTRGSRSCLWVVEEGLLGWGRRRVGGLHDVDGLPVAAEVLCDARRELEPHSEAAVLEEDVRVLELGHVEGDPLAFLGQRPLRAADEARLLEG